MYRRLIDVGVLAGFGLSIVILAFNILSVNAKSGQSKPYVRPISIGSPVSIPKIDFRVTPGSILVAVKSPCDECYLVGPKYQGVLRKAHENGVQIILVSPDPDWVSSLGIDTSFMKRVQELPSSYGIPLNPGLMWVTPDGVVDSEWVGKFTDIESGQIEAKILRTATPPPSINGDISSVFATLLRKENEFTILDIRERPDFASGHHQAQAINIPMQELDVRARHEIDQLTPVLIDCSETPPFICLSGKIVLEAQGFRSVAMIDRGKVPPLGCLNKRVSKAPGPVDK